MKRESEFIEFLLPVVALSDRPTLHCYDPELLWNEEELPNPPRLTVPEIELIELEDRLPCVSVEK